MDLDDDFDADDVVNLKEVEEELEGDLTMSALLESDDDEAKGSVPPEDDPDDFDDGKERQDDNVIPAAISAEVNEALHDSDDDIDDEEKEKKQRYRKQFNFISGVKRDEIRNSEEVYEDHGEQLFEPFNLKQERQEGFIDQFGTFHSNEKDKQEAWEDILDEDRAKPQEERKLQLKKDTIEKHKSAYQAFEDSQNIQEPPDLFRVLNVVIPLLQPEENIESAIQRYGEIVAKGTEQGKKSGKKRPVNPAWQSGRPKKKRKKKKRSWEVSSDEDEDMPDAPNANAAKERPITEIDVTAARKKIEILTENAQDLLVSGDKNMSNIYSLPRSRMLKFVQAKDQRLAEQRRQEERRRQVESLNQRLEHGESTKSQPKKPRDKYEFKWDDDEKQKIQGQYVLGQFQKWEELGHFGQRVIQMRKVGTEEWVRVEKFDMSLFQ